MGGVHGDLLRLGFIQTTIMEMDQPPSAQSAGPAQWVKSRQFTGRIVKVSNSKIFSDPVFNYIRDFPFIREEMVIRLPTRRSESASRRSCLKPRRSTASIRAGSRKPLICELASRQVDEPVRRETRPYFISAQLDDDSAG